MPKNYKLLHLILIILLSSFILLNLAKAQDPREVLAKQAGINPDKIPTDPESLKEYLRDKYLKQEWDKIISNKTIIGPINNFFKANPLAFKILFNEEYSFSLTFFFIFIIWLFIAIITADIIRSLSITKQSIINFTIGILFSIILAQVGFINAITLFSLDLILKQDKWWIRWLVGLGIFVCLFIIFKIDKIIIAELKKNREAKLKAYEARKIKEHESFIQGVEEGQKLTKDIKRKF